MKEELDLDEARIEDLIEELSSRSLRSNHIRDLSEMLGDDFDLGNTDTSDLIKELNFRNLSGSDLSSLRYTVTGIDDEDKDAIFYSPKTMDESRKLEIILKHLDRYDYLTICKLFEGFNHTKINL